MEITIFRRRFTPWGVDGTMAINGVYFTGTVEHPKKFLPAGTYQIAPVPIRFQQEIEVEVKETEEEKKNNNMSEKNEKKNNNKNEKNEKKNNNKNEKNEKKKNNKSEKNEKKFEIKIIEEIRTMPTILQVKDRVPKTPVLRKPFLKPGFGPFALKYGSIVMGKSVKTGLVAYNEEKFQEFCKMIDKALEKKENVTLVIKDWEKDDIPKEYMVVLPDTTHENAWSRFVPDDETMENRYKNKEAKKHVCFSR